MVSDGIRAFSSESDSSKERNYIAEALELESGRTKTALESESTMVALGQDSEIARSQATQLRRAAGTAVVLKQGDRIKRLEENNELLSQQLAQNNEALSKLSKQVGIYAKIIDSFSASRQGGKLSFTETEDKKSEEKDKKSKNGYSPYPLSR